MSFVPILYMLRKRNRTGDLHTESKSPWQRSITIKLCLYHSHILKQFRVYHSYQEPWVEVAEAVINYCALLFPRTRTDSSPRDLRLPANDGNGCKRIRILGFVLNWIGETWKHNPHPYTTHNCPGPRNPVLVWLWEQPWLVRSHRENQEKTYSQKILAPENWRPLLSVFCTVIYGTASWPRAFADC